jgi:hypothetical protein
LTVKRTGGIVVRVDGALRFLPAAVALRVAPPPRVTPVPGAPSELLGITIHEGVIVPPRSSHQGPNSPTPGTITVRGVSHASPRKVRHCRT